MLGTLSSGNGKGCADCWITAQARTFQNIVNATSVFVHLCLFWPNLLVHLSTCEIAFTGVEFIHSQCHYLLFGFAHNSDRTTFKQILPTASDCQSPQVWNAVSPPTTSLLARSLRGWPSWISRVQNVCNLVGFLESGGGRSLRLSNSDSNENSVNADYPCNPNEIGAHVFNMQCPCFGEDWKWCLPYVIRVSLWQGRQHMEFANTNWTAPRIPVIEAPFNSCWQTRSTCRGGGVSGKVLLSLLETENQSFPKLQKRSVVLKAAATQARLFLTRVKNISHYFQSGWPHSKHLWSVSFSEHLNPVWPPLKRPSDCRLSHYFCRDGSLFWTDKGLRCALTNPSSSLVRFHCNTCTPRFRQLDKGLCNLSTMFFSCQFLQLVALCPQVLLVCSPRCCTTPSWILLTVRILLTPHDVADV